MKHLILFGIQGSGKGTQAAKITTNFPQYKHLEMGDIFRGLKGMDNHLGNYFKQIDEGKYLSDSVVTAVFDIYMSIIEPGELMLMDGFPRSMGQMYMFLDRIWKAKMDFMAINLNLSMDVAIDRLSKRQFYRKDGYIYHIRNRHDLEYAQSHNYEIFHREDDTPDFIRRRFASHTANTVPMLDVLESKGLLHHVDADQGAEEVYSDICKIIGL